MKDNEKISKFMTLVSVAQSEGRKTITLDTEVAAEVAQFVAKQIAWLNKLGRKPLSNPTREAKYMRKSRAKRDNSTTGKIKTPQS